MNYSEVEMMMDQNPTWSILELCLGNPQSIAWRFIPDSKWLIIMISKSPKDRVVGPLPNGRTSWLVNEGDPKYLRYLG